MQARPSATPAGTGQSFPQDPHDGTGGASALRAIAVGAIVAASLLATVAPATAAARQYIIREPISRHLEKTSDDFGLCSRRGISMSPTVVFQPKGSAGQSFYWDRATDRFIKYPGFSGCTVWRRVGQG